MPFADYDDFTSHEPTDLAWAAGFIDGEGTFYARAQQPSTRTSAHRQLSLAVTQVDRRPLDRLVALFGGRIDGPYNGAYRWSVTSHARVRAAIEALYPYLSVKREQADEALRRYDDLDVALARRRVAETVTSVCPTCDHEFTHPDYRERIYCSHSCAARSRHVVAGGV